MTTRIDAQIDPPEPASPPEREPVDLLGYMGSNPQAGAKLRSLFDRYLDEHPSFTDDLYEWLVWKFLSPERIERRFESEFEAMFQAERSAGRI